MLRTTYSAVVLGADDEPLVRSLRHAAHRAAGGCSLLLWRLYRTRRLTVQQVADRTGVSPQTVRRIFSCYGVEPFCRRPLIFSEAQERGIADRYKAGESLATLGKATASSNEAVRNALARQGVATRPVGGREGTTLSDATLDETRRLYVTERRSVRDMARLMGIVESTAYARLRHAGVLARDRSEAGRLHRRRRKLTGSTASA